MLDDESTDDPAGINRSGANVWRKAFGIDLDHPVSGQQRSQLNPAVERILLKLAKIRKILKIGWILRCIIYYVQGYLPKRYKNLV